MTPDPLGHWPVLDKSDTEIIAEILRQTDRAAALIATSYLEHRLFLAIQSRTVRNEKVESEIYRKAGPLASFSAKKDLGLLLGIYDTGVHKILHTIRQIRNEFAHKAIPLNFKTQKINSLCENIALAGEFFLENEDDERDKITFQVIPDGTPRTNFINAVRACVLVLEMETKQLPLRRPAEPVIPSLDILLHKPSPKK
jgi:hypothetical protein